MKSELKSVVWPPDPIKTARLVLREPEARDRTAMIELFAAPEVGTYIGGAQSRDERERTMLEIPRRRTGLFVVDLDGAMLGMVSLYERDPNHPDQVRPELAAVELGHLFLPSSWGHGYATESCAAALTWFATARPGEPVVLTTQSANLASMRVATKLGFTEVERYEAWAAEQWLCLWTPPN